jgi:glycosyltransferase involved in cell wall biosynthesis
VKLACVVHRYGADIAGGSEAHCRQLAEHLAATHDVTVLTTCARDYVTWANVHSAGSADERGLRVIRFPVTNPRDLEVFAELSREVFTARAAGEREDAWFRENGPSVPALLDHLRAHGREFDAVLFWSYRYYPSYFGLPIVSDRAVLVPTAEEDPAIDLDVVAGFLSKPAGYLFLTPEEETLVSRRAGRALQPSAIIGAGIEPASRPPHRTALDPLNLRDPYVLYLGRVDRNKGCGALLDHFQAFVDSGGEATLVLAGPATMPIPVNPHIRALGFVEDDVRDALLAHARALIVPSPFESLSLVLLEAWNRGIPALVNGGCRPLEGQVRRAGGGLAYRLGREFTEALAFLLSHPVEAQAFGRQGLAYVEREYRWPIVMARVEALLRRVVKG